MGAPRVRLTRFAECPFFYHVQSLPLHAMARTDAREVKHSVRDGAQVGAPSRAPLPSRGGDSVPEAPGMPTKSAPTAPGFAQMCSSRQAPELTAARGATAATLSRTATTTTSA